MKGIIFDLDGTLIDSAPEIHRIANEVLSREELGEITLAQTRSYVGHGLPNFVAQMLSDKNCPAEGDLHARVVQDILSLYVEGHQLITLYPGALEALEQLSQLGFQMAICTNKPYAPAQATLKHFDLQHFFNVVIAGDSLPKRKPDPLPLLETAKRLETQNVVFVGDSEVDAETAQAANVPFALFTQGYRKGPVTSLPHDVLFDDFGKLPEIIQSICK